MSTRRAIAALIALLALALAPEAAQGAEPAPPKEAPQAAPDPASGDTGYLSYQDPGLPESPGLVSVAGRVVGSLALVVGLIFVTALVLKRWLGGAKAPLTSRKVSELIEATPLGGKRFLYLIRVADRLLVVGGGGDRLELLSEIKDPEVLEQVAAMPRRSDFFELFHRVRGAGSKGGAPAAEPAEQAAAG